MAQPSDNLRDRLLAAMPQTTNLETYREEVATFLGREERAFSTFRRTHGIITLCAFALGFWAIAWLPTHNIQVVLYLAGFAALLLLIAVSEAVVSGIRRYQIDLLKEIKQVQLQILELQASLQKER